MANANSSSQAARALRQSQDEAESLEAVARAGRLGGERVARRLGSGVYSFVAPLLRPNPYAGLERLDRPELDETDEG
jgi:hypothetical protein